jgi:hypothetical protein
VTPQSMLRRGCRPPCRRPGQWCRRAGPRTLPVGATVTLALLFSSPCSPATRLASLPPGLTSRSCNGGHPVLQGSGSEIYLRIGETCLAKLAATATVVRNTGSRGSTLKPNFTPASGRHTGPRAHCSLRPENGGRGSKGSSSSQIHRSNIHSDQALHFIQTQGFPHSIAIWLAMKRLSTHHCLLVAMKRLSSLHCHLVSNEAAFFTSLPFG